MRTKPNIFGSYISAPPSTGVLTEEKISEARTQTERFMTYIWGQNGLDAILKTLKHTDYGSDLVLILLEFYLDPLPSQHSRYKKIGAYRKKERSIGIPTVVHLNEFWQLSESEKRKFLSDIIKERLALLEDIVKKKKLDTDVEKLRSDVEHIMATYRM